MSDMSIGSPNITMDKIKAFRSTGLFNRKR